MNMCESMRIYTEKILAEGERFGKLSTQIINQVKGSSTK